MKKTILIVEDEEDIIDILTYSFENEGFSIKEAKNGESAILIVKKGGIDLIILDIMLPDISGFEVCKKLSTMFNIPIIMLTAKNDIVDKVLGLELGADDYITKPFDIREVLVRVKVCLRRIESLKEIVEENFIEIDDYIKINKESREVFKEKQLLKLKPKEYELLLFLSENRRIVFSRDKLLERIWGFDFEGDIRTVDVHIQRLRKKLDNPCKKSLIETVFGIGYKML